MSDKVISLSQRLLGLYDERARLTQRILEAKQLLRDSLNNRAAHANANERTLGGGFRVDDRTPDVITDDVLRRRLDKSNPKGQ